MKLKIAMRSIKKFISDNIFDYTYYYAMRRFFGLSITAAVIDAIGWLPKALAVIGIACGLAQLLTMVLG